jgi:Holliday junction resolvasome RuvABC endonuclease subunit
MRIIGIDPGTAKMGVCSITGTRKNPEFIPITYTADKADDIDMKFRLMVGRAISHIATLAPDLVVCEYPFNIQGHAKVLVEMFGAIRFHCLVTNTPFLALSQSRIKKYATGAGKDVEKSAMVMRAFKEYGLELSDDSADAFWIAHVGMTWIHGSDVKFRQDSVADIRKKAVDKAAKRSKKK